MLNGMFWVLCFGAKWRADGTFEAVLARLQLTLREDGLGVNHQNSFGL
ncbi:MAG TPA: hypothetical protein DCE28_05945 [Halomonas sp.]|nr:hypothetical protein [Halomonas sp.]